MPAAGQVGGAGGEVVVGGPAGVAVGDSAGDGAVPGVGAGCGVPGGTGGGAGIAGTVGGGDAGPAEGVCPCANRVGCVAQNSAHAMAIGIVRRIIEVTR